MKKTTTTIAFSHDSDKQSYKDLIVVKQSFVEQINKTNKNSLFYLKNTIPITKRMKTLWFFVFTHDLVKHIIKTQTIVLSLHGSDTKASENLWCV